MARQYINTLSILAGAEAQYIDTLTHLFFLFGFTIRMDNLVEHIVPINRGANNIKHVVNK